MIKKTLIFFAITFISLELFSFLGTKLGLFIVNDTPYAYKLALNANGLKWRRDDMEWGAWHKSNYEDRHVTSCFDVIYKTNSIGARDDEFPKSGKERIILLGDSAAEGYGDNREDTIEKIIENKLQRPVMNFGSGGNFGPAQYYLIYKNLAKHYEHDKIIIMFAPSNDFIDNDLDEMKKNGMANHVTSDLRYRPYIKNNPPYEIYYPDNSVKNYDYGLHNQGAVGLLKMAILNFLWSSNPIKSIYYINTGQTMDKIYSGYYDASIEQQKAVSSVLDKLIFEVDGRKIIFVLLANKYDIEKFKESGVQYTNQYWYKKLADQQRKNQNFILVDTMDKIDGRSFKTCDGHYSRSGSETIADLIIKNLE